MTLLKFMVNISTPPLTSSAFWCPCLCFFRSMHLLYLHTIVCCEGEDFLFWLNLKYRKDSLWYFYIIKYKAMVFYYFIHLKVFPFHRCNTLLSLQKYKIKLLKLPLVLCSKLASLGDFCSDSLNLFDERLMVFHMSVDFSLFVHP